MCPNCPYITVCPNGPLVTVCPKAADIALVVDQSASIAQPPGGYNNWYVSILNFLGNITIGFPVGPQLTQFGLLKFSDVATVQWYLNTYKDNTGLLAAVKSLQIGGGETNLADALRVARTQILFNSPGSRVGVKKIIILLTDGAANRDVQAGRCLSSAKPVGGSCF